MIAGQVNQLEAITENLANCTTPGYRRLQVAHKTFESLLQDAVNPPGNYETGKRYDPISVDFTPGPLKTTERSLDFAIHNEGFFVVEKDGQEYYTRNGHFSVDAQGNLFNADGFAVMGSLHPITIPAKTDLASLTVDQNNGLRANGKLIDTIRIAHFSDPSQLNRAGTTLFTAPSGVSPEDPKPGTHVINGSLEASNTTVFGEMAEMISCMRSYEACQRMIRAHDENEGKMIQQVGSA